MRSFFRRNVWKITFGTLVGVPAVGAGSLALYIKYRAQTRPPEVTFRPLVTGDGSLILNDIVIPAPTYWMLIKRAAELLFIFLPLFIIYPIMRLNKNLRHRWMMWLLRSVERAGPAFVKCGQWSCTRKDLFSDEFREVFQKLYSEVSEHPICDTLRIIEEDFKVKPSEVFARIEPVPCGSGSIGQVHVAYLKGSETKVVVKVMHPNVVETIARDFWIINGIASFVDRNFRSLEQYDVKKLALAFTNHLAAQLDFRIEAEHLELFRKHFEEVDYVEFPKPIMSSHRVLVESFAAGVPATPEFLRSQQEYVRDRLAVKGLNTWCKMLLRDNFLHGDMHPGNILIDTKNPHSPVVTLIDVGLCQKLNEHEAPTVFNLMSSFVHWKSKLCVDTIMSMADEQRFTDREKFQRELDDVFEHYRPASDSDEKIVTNVLESIFEVVRNNNVQMEPAYVSMLFAVLVLESFIMNLNPEFNMVRHCAPWLITEGHVTFGLIKNIIRSQVDNRRADFLTLKGRLSDWYYNRSGGGDGTVNGSTLDGIFVPEGVRRSAATA